MSAEALPLARPAPISGTGSRPDLDQRIGGGSANGSSSRPAGNSTAAPVPPSPIQAKRSQYGRARPLNRSEESSPKRPESENQWKSPKNYDDLTIG